MRTEEDHGAHARGVDGGISVQHARVLERQPVLEPNVTRNAKWQTGRGSEGQLDDGYARVRQRLDRELGLCLSVSRQSQVTPLATPSRTYRALADRRPWSRGPSH